MRKHILTAALFLLLLTPASAQVDECKQFADTWMSYAGKSLYASGVEAFDYQVDREGRWNLPAGYRAIGGSILHNGGIMIYGYPERLNGQIVTDNKAAEILEWQSTDYVAIFCSLSSDFSASDRPGMHDAYWYKQR